MGENFQYSGYYGHRGVYHSRSESAGAPEHGDLHRFLLEEPHEKHDSYFSLSDVHVTRSHEDSPELSGTPFTVPPEAYL